MEDIEFQCLYLGDHADNPHQLGEDHKAAVSGNVHAMNQTPTHFLLRATQTQSMCQRLCCSEIRAGAADQGQQQQQPGGPAEGRAVVTPAHFGVGEHSGLPCVSLLLQVPLQKGGSAVLQP